MADDRRLVYSTEQGALDKPMQKRNGKRKLPAQQCSSSAIRKPNKQGVRIRRESKGRGGKTVCIIDGLSLDQPAMKKLLKTLKSQLGTGGAVKTDHLEIQGDHREKLLLLLEKQGHYAKLSGG